MFEIGEIVRRKDNRTKYMIISKPWKVGGNEVIKIASVPDDGLYLVEDVRGCIRVDVLEKIKKLEGQE